MHIPKALISTAVLAAVVGLASPASAQHHRGGSGGNGGSNRGSENRGSENRGSAAAVPRATPQNSAPRTDNRSQGGTQQRADNGARAVAPPSAYRGSQGGNGYSNGNNGSSTRSYSNGNNRGYSNGSYNRGYSNGSYNRSYSNGNHGYGYSNHGRYYGNYGHYGYRSYAPIHFYRPYYSFRPRVSLGFGLWVGYPVPYYDPYYYPSYGYPAATYPAYPPSAYPAAPYQQNPQTISPQTAPEPFDDDDNNSLDVQPAQANTGGLSFDITPGEAEVVIDGKRVGTVDQFTPTSQPLGLLAGRHRVEVRAPGYKTITFEVNIVAGQVIPYQGKLER